jgi:hypothetical protein
MEAVGACRRSLAFFTIVATLGALITTVVVAPAAQADQGSVTFSFSGTSQTWTVPARVTAIQVDAFGGAGDGVYGGLGGEERATITVTPGQVLQVNVGGAGVGLAGGFNGGGAGGSYGPPDGGAGGGASDVRVAATDGSYPLANRVVVAGGGGGEAPNGAAGLVHGYGGSGGASVGGTGANGDGQWAGGGGGTQTSGGAGDQGGPGGFGQGASGGNFAGAGGGGWYGGGGGGSELYGGSAGGGGGGSNYAALSATGVASIRGARAGNGVIVVTWPPAGTSGAASGMQAFSYTGAPQFWTVPAGVHYVQVDAVGASGAGCCPGAGGEDVAVVPVTPGQMLVVIVAGQGVGISGGYGGGGAGGWYHATTGAAGGASDVRAGGFGLDDRLVVGAGGGGAAPDSDGFFGVGGAGGGSSGLPGGNGSGSWLGGGGGGTVRKFV